MINIEVKVPHEDHAKSFYDFKKAISLVHKTIIASGLESNCCVSSFDSDILEELDSLNKCLITLVRIICLYNFEENYELPEPDVYAAKGDGINISSTKLTQEVIQNCHARGKIVGLWVNKQAFQENLQYYEEVMRSGADFICTDYPLEAMAVRSKVLDR